MVYSWMNAQQHFFLVVYDSNLSFVVVLNSFPNTGGKKPPQSKLFQLLDSTGKLWLKWCFLWEPYSFIFSYFLYVLAYFHMNEQTKKLNAELSKSHKLGIYSKIWSESLVLNFRACLEPLCSVFFSNMRNQRD